MCSHNRNYSIKKLVDGWWLIKEMKNENVHMQALYCKLDVVLVQILPYNCSETDYSFCEDSPLSRTLPSTRMRVSPSDPFGTPLFFRSAPGNMLHTLFIITSKVDLKHPVSNLKSSSYVFEHLFKVCICPVEFLHFQPSNSIHAVTHCRSFNWCHLQQVTWSIERKISFDNSKSEC